MAAFSCTNSLNYMRRSAPTRTSTPAAAVAPPLAPRLHLEYHYCYYSTNNTHTSGGSGRSRAAQIFAVPVPDVSATAAYAQLETEDNSTSTSTSDGWQEFAERVSGEWDGFGADFTTEGKPIELPESVVPEAFREWEVKVFDWQTQCPTLAQSLPPDNNNNNNNWSFMYKTIKLLPTVGCEADAATRHSIEERNINHDSVKFAYQLSGSYVAAWPMDEIGVEFELEHCLIDPRDKESRVRIIQVLQNRDGLRLKRVKVFVEQWYGPFRDGDQLGGCAIRDSAFASTQPLDASRVIGVWQGRHAIASFHNSHKMIQQVGDESLRKSVRSEDDLILLPKQLWCLLKRAEDGGIYCEAGWLLEPRQAITSKCTLWSTAEIQEIAIANETLSPVL